MVLDVILSVRGSQSYAAQEPEIIELVTEGTLEQTPDGWKLANEESNLTGLEGVNTTFLVKPEEITLIRTGKLNSQMVFREGEAYDSLYQMEFGTLMLTVCATRVDADITTDGGVIDLRYNIGIEQSAAGVIEYHLDIRVK